MQRIEASGGRMDRKSDAQRMTISATKRSADHRARLRAQGLRPVQIWVPDTRSPRFAAECRRQSRLLRNDPAEREALGLIERLADWESR